MTDSTFLASPEPPAGLHVVTPLVYSAALSARAGHNIYLKLETSQLTGSFKPRGIGRACWAAARRLGPGAHLVCASGGNAGLAAAQSCQTLGVKCTVFVHDKTEPAIIARMRACGAAVVVASGGWDTVNASAHSLAAEDASAEYIHPFEGANVLRGHTSLVDEVYDQLPASAAAAGVDAGSGRPDMVGCSVGGGGLIAGLMLRLGERAAEGGFEPAHVLGMATTGGDSWGLSVEGDAFVELEQTGSIAVSLVCKACSQTSVQCARRYATTGSITGADDTTTGRVGKYLSSIRFPDPIAGAATWMFRDDTGLTVEIACGAALVPAYQPAALKRVIADKGLAKAGAKLNVVLVVCGGSRVNDDVLDEYRRQWGNGEGPYYVDGVPI